MREPAEHRFAAPAGELCWFEWGAHGQGPSLLLLHATGFHARCWDQVIARLPADQHVIAVELRGHGRSYRPDTLVEWSVTADDIAAFVASQTDGPFVAAGHSMGGHIAARVAARLPEALTRLVLVDPVIMDPAIYAQGLDQLAMDPDDHPIARRRNDWESAEAMIARFADRAPYSGWVPEVLADYCRFGLLPVEGGLELACPPRLEASAYIGAPRSDPYAEVAKVQCPVTVVRARNVERTSSMDFSNSPTWPQLASRFAQGRDLDWGDLTHFVPMEAPDRLAALIAEELRA